jgi:chitodextrinase
MTTSDTYITLDQLITAGSAYEFTLSSRCGASWGPESPIISFSTPSIECLPPQVSVSSITSSSAIIRWPSIPGGSSLYQVRYRKKGQTDSDWISVGLSTPFNSYNIEGLIPSTEYEYQISVNCGNRNWSEYSPIQRFTTLPPGPTCSAPAGLNSSVFSTNVTITWQNVSQATRYEVIYSVQGESWVSSFDIYGNSYTIINLRPYATYNYRVRAYCPSSGGWSEYSSIQSFATSGPKLAAAGQAPLRIYPNPAQNYIQVELPENESLEDWEFTFIDLSGRAARQVRVPASETAGLHAELSLAGLEAGSYILKCRSGAYQSYARLQVIR